jgi:RNA polymerase sigma factor (sigma-70 family)
MLIERAGMAAHAVRLAAIRLPETDAELLDRFATRRDEAAFAELVARHGRLVQGVARRVVGRVDAAEDVFQATFFLLASKAGAVRWGPTVGPWLFQAARRLAWKARRRLARHRTAPLADQPAAAPQAWDDVRAAIDDELAGLPAAFRDPLVLCYFEGLTRDEAAGRLGLSLTTFRGRLERGRDRLRARLLDRGLGLPAALGGLMLTDSHLPAALPLATARTATEFVATATAPPAVAALLGGGASVRAIAASVVLLAAVCGAAALAAALPTDPPPTAAATQPAPAAPAEPKAGVDSHGDPLPPGAVARLGTIRFRTGSTPVAIAFSPDGKQLAAWGQAVYKRDRFFLFDAASGKPLRSEETREDNLLALAWSRDGKGYAVVKKGVGFAANRVINRDLQVWEFTSPDSPRLPPSLAGGPRGFMPLPPGVPPLSFDAAAATPDGRKLAVATSTADVPGPVRVYPLGATQSIRDSKSDTKWDAPPVSCGSLAFSPDGKQLVGIGPFHCFGPPPPSTLVMWDAGTGKVVRTWPIPKAGAQFGDYALATSNDRAAVGLKTGDLFVVDRRSGEARTVPTAHKNKTGGGDVSAIAFSPDGARIATTGTDLAIRLWDANTGAKLRDLGRHYSPVQALAFSPDGKRLAAGGLDQLIRLWDAESGKELVTDDGHKDRVGQVSISGSGTAVLTPSWDNTLSVWRAPGWGRVTRIQTGGLVSGSQLTSDGRSVLAVTEGGEGLRVWDTLTGADATPSGFPKTRVVGEFRFTPDGTTLIAFSENRLTAWSWPGGQKLWAVETPRPAKPQGVNAVTDLAVSPDGRHFVTLAHRYWTREENGHVFGYADDGILDLWETATGTRVTRLVESLGGSRPPVYTAEGYLIHTGGGTLKDRTGREKKTAAEVCLIDPLTGHILREFTPSDRPDKGPHGGNAAALSADGKVLFRSTHGGAVEVFEVATGRFRTALVGHLDTVHSLAAPAADVRRLVSGSVDTTALVWDVGFAAAAPVPLTSERRSSLWAELKTEDAAAAYKAMRALAADPAGYCRLAGEALIPTQPGPTVAELAPIFRNLDSPQYAVRSAAAADLAKFGERAVPAVRKRLETESAAEVQAALTAFLARHDAPATRLRQTRAVELLEHLGTPEAKQVLAKLAAGGPSRQTADASAALKRLAAR